MSAPIVYRWDDANAPVLAGVNTSLIALLKACLVDGYGTKAAAGWTMPFSNAEGTKAAFRNNATDGTGFYLQVDNTVAAYYAACKGYESMADVDTGVNPFTTSTVYAFGGASAGTTARPWVLVADGRLFYLNVWPTATASGFATAARATCITLVFGDGISLYPSDAYFCVLCGPTTVNTNYNYGMVFSLPSVASSTRQFAARDVSGVNLPNGWQLTANGGPLNYGSFGAAVGMTRVAGAEIFSRPYVNDGVAYTMRGYLPGLWFPCHNYTDFTNLETVPLGDHEFLVFSYLQAGMYAIDLSESFRP